jgi:hypothetical protein
MAQNGEETNLLISAAKVLGKTAGKIAAIAGVEGQPAQTSVDRPAKRKLPKKNKTRLPRRQKKAQKAKTSQRAAD